MTDILKLKNVYIYKHIVYTKEPINWPESSSGRRDRTSRNRPFPHKTCFSPDRVKLYSDIPFDKKQAIITEHENCLYTRVTASNLAHYFQDIFYLLHSVINYPQLFNCKEFTNIIIPQAPVALSNREYIYETTADLISRGAQTGKSKNSVQIFCLVLFLSLIFSPPPSHPRGRTSRPRLNRCDPSKIYFFKNISFIINIDRWMTFEVDDKNLIEEIRNNMFNYVRLAERPGDRKTVIIHDSQVRGKDLINLDLLLHELNLKNYNVIIHNIFDRMSIHQQIQDYYNADILISPGGANMINCIFSKNIKKVLCLCHKPSPKYHNICHWWTGPGDTLTTLFKDIDISPEIYNIICKSTNEHIIKENINGGLVPNLVLDVPKILSYIES